MNSTLQKLSQNPTVQKTVVLVVVFAVGAAVGRYSLPAKVVTKTEVQTVTKVVQDTTKDKQDNKVITITETKKPDGTDTKVTQITDKDTSQTNTNSTTNTSDKTQDSTTTQYNTGTFGVNALAGIQFGSDAKPTYGLSVQKKLLGPIEMGLFGFTNKLFGASVGLRF